MFRQRLYELVDFALTIVAVRAGAERTIAVADDHLLPDGTVDVEKIDLISRLGGDGYSTLRDRFSLPKPGTKS